MLGGFGPMMLGCMLRKTRSLWVALPGLSRFVLRTSYFSRMNKEIHLSPLWSDTGFASLTLSIDSWRTIQLVATMGGFHWGDGTSLSPGFSAVLLAAFEKSRFNPSDSVTR